jgi:hypothetical protein
MLPAGPKPYRSRRRFTLDHQHADPDPEQVRFPGLGPSSGPPRSPCREQRPDHHADEDADRRIQQTAVFMREAKQSAN